MGKHESQEKKELPEEADNRKEDIAKELRPDQIVDHRQDGQHLSFTGRNGITLHIDVLSDHIIRVRYLTDSDLQTDFSYAVDPDFAADKVPIEIKETAIYFRLSTPTLTCRITKKKMKLHFYDSKGRTLCEDKESYYRRESLMKGISEISITKKAPPAASYWGLGDKVPEGNLRGHAFENWNTDAYGYERGDDPLYRSIPFYAALHEGRAYGIFLDNSYRTHFDFDSDEGGISSFSAEGGIMDYYFIHGPKLTDVTQRYSRLTGTPEMPPMWALGYHQSRWSYYPESRVRKLADTFREKQIPCDVLYLDIDYMDDYRVFTWNNNRFPDPKKLIGDLKEKGFETVVMVDPGIKVDKDYTVYQEGRQKDYFCKRADGDTMIAPVWPPECVFPDFTNPDVRDWWGGLHDELINDRQVSGIWNDMNEPAVFEVKSKTLPESIRHDFDGHPCSHRKAHNIYGMQMARASWQGLKKHRPDKRPFLLTRANFAGGQRYAALWTGDNIADWDHLKLTNEQCQRLSISGYSFVGSDIGGFVGKPSAELFTRWLQLGIFHPLFRNHSMGYNIEGAAAVKKDEVELKKAQQDMDQEPWSFGKKYTDINRSVIGLRYRLLHYLYTAFYHYTEHGKPILRPLSYGYQSDEAAIEQRDQFLFGDKILVSPVLNKGQTEVDSYLPAGDWYDFRTNKAYGGRQNYTVDAPLKSIPFFIKAGTVLPLREVMQHTSERKPERLELNIYFADGQATSHLYEDSGDGYGYRDGNYQLTTFLLEGNNDAQRLTLTAERKGRFEPEYRSADISLIGLPFVPSSVMVDGHSVAFEEDSDNAHAVYRISASPGFAELKIS